MFLSFEKGKDAHDLLLNDMLCNHTAIEWCDRSVFMASLASLATSCESYETPYIWLVVTEFQLLGLSFFFLHRGSIEGILDVPPYVLSI